MEMVIQVKVAEGHCGMLVVVFLAHLCVLELLSHFAARCSFLEAYQFALSSSLIARPFSQ